MKRYCPNFHIVNAAECTPTTAHGSQRPAALHCPKCGLVTREVGDLRSLPKRHVDVWRELTTGDNTKVIAARLQISPGTMKVYISRLYAATGAQSRVALALLWLRLQEAQEAASILRGLGVVA